MPNMIASGTPSDDNRPVDLSLCWRVGGPFASYVNHLSPEDGNLVFVPSVLLLIANLIVGFTLFTLARICDKEELIVRRRDRAQALSKKIDEHYAAYNHREILLVKKTNHGKSEAVKDYTCPPDLEFDEPGHADMCAWRRKYSQIENALSMATKKTEAVEEQLLKLSKPTWPEQMDRYLAIPAAGVKATKARCGTLALGVTLFLLSIIPVVFTPFIILAHQHCDRSTAPHESVTTVLWIFYALLACMPAFLAWRMCIKALWHWNHAPCVECTEAPNIHTEGTGNRRASIALTKILSNSSCSDVTSLSSPISPISPIHPQRCGSPTDVCGLPKISEEDEREHQG